MRAGLGLLEGSHTVTPALMMGASIVSSCFPNSGSCDCFGALYRGKLFAGKMLGTIPGIKQLAKQVGQKTGMQTNVGKHSEFLF